MISLFEQAKTELIARCRAYIHIRGSGFLNNNFVAEHVIEELNTLDSGFFSSIQENHLLPFKKVVLQCIVKLLRERLPITSRLSESVREFVGKYLPLLIPDETYNYRKDIDQINKYNSSSISVSLGHRINIPFALLHPYLKIHPEAQNASVNRKKELSAEEFVLLDESVVKDNPEVCNLPRNIHPALNFKNKHNSEVLQIQPEDKADSYQNNL